MSRNGILNSRIDRVVTAYTIQGNGQYNSGNGWLGIFSTPLILYFSSLNSILITFVTDYCELKSIVYFFFIFFNEKRSWPKSIKIDCYWISSVDFKQKSIKSTTIPFHLSLSGHVLKVYYYHLDWLSVHIEISFMITGHSWRARSSRAKDPLQKKVFPHKDPEPDVQIPEISGRSLATALP